MSVDVMLLPRHPQMALDVHASRHITNLVLIHHDHALVVSLNEFVVKKDAEEVSLTRAH